jgi:hypothetical protein
VKLQPVAGVNLTVYEWTPALTVVPPPAATSKASPSPPPAAATLPGLASPGAAGISSSSSGGAAAAAAAAQPGLDALLSQIARQNSGGRRRLYEGALGLVSWGWDSIFSSDDGAGSSRRGLQQTTPPRRRNSSRPAAGTRAGAANSSTAALASGSSSSSVAAGLAGSTAASNVTIAVASGQNATVAVRAEFKRTVTTVDYRLNGTLQLANPTKAPIAAGKLYVIISLSNGTSARAEASCVVAGANGTAAAAAAARRAGGAGANGTAEPLTLPPSPAVLNCSWALAAPLSSPLSGQAIAVLSGPSPAAMSKVVDFSFANATAESAGACAAVSATWALEGAGAAAAPQPRSVAGVRGTPAPSSAVQLCESKSYSWSVVLGPLGAQQCAAAAALDLVGAAAAAPTNGTQARQSAAAKAKVSVTGCPAPTPVRGG